ncbi:hypothetical protein KR51_00015750 [Rubidibacter lacunae KORDI 51-2]|uniref:Uncharacterized protein n=1 Tax=Rubidibacter lacunae KORDI 51-2 TaxID=582515 RepID=U5DMB3_9CHRO|nr:hypothetical protein KR51_00015750 [Rubidibacter lacunae KORDI 51-2]
MDWMTVSKYVLQIRMGSRRTRNAVRHSIQTQTTDPNKFNTAGDRGATPLQSDPAMNNASTGHQPKQQA